MGNQSLLRCWQAGVPANQVSVMEISAKDPFVSTVNNPTSLRHFQKSALL